MTLDEILRKVDDLDLDFDFALDKLTDADGLTICPVEYAEGMEELRDALKSLRSLREAIHIANWSSTLNTF
jgi:hypothetical protein